MRAEHAEMKQEGKTITVDDELRIRKYLQSVLGADGYHVETVSNGKDAISIVGPRF
jgi:CheY-like chemotaxis protein